MARICICGSMTHSDKIDKLSDLMRAEGHEVLHPLRGDLGDDWASLTLDQQIERKTGYIQKFMEASKSADAVLIANYPKHGVAGYVGANTLMEAAIAHALSVTVIFLHELGPQPCRVEALALQTRCLNGDPTAL